MNRSLLWLILLGSAACHAVGFFVFGGYFTRSHSSSIVAQSPARPEPKPTPFTVKADGITIGLPPTPDIALPDSAAAPTPNALLPVTAEANRILHERAEALQLASATPAMPFESGSPQRTVIFMLDKSGSMYETVGGVRRVDLATQELRRMIAQLDRRTRFNIVLYAEKVILFQTEAMPATAEWKMLATRFLQRDESCGGSTNFPSGYQSALAQKPHTILLLTDGEFNVPDQSLLAQTRSLREKLASSAQLNILGFFVRPDTNANKLLSKLCTDNHGELQFWKLATHRVASIE